MLEKLPFGKERGQGAVEYLLILAAVLVVVAVAVYYVIGVGGGPTIIGTATLSDNNLRFTPEEGLNPDPLTDDWEWSVWTSAGASVLGWTADSTNLTVGTTVTLSTTASTVNVGDELRIKSGDKSYAFTIVAA